MQARKGQGRRRWLIPLVALVAAIVLAWQLDLHPPTSALLNRVLRSDIYDTVSHGQEIALWEKGAMIREPFTVPFANEFELAIRYHGKYPPLFYRPKCVLDIEYYQGDRLVLRKRYENNMPESTDHSGESQGDTFDVVLLPQHMGTRAHSVVVRVVEPDERMAAYKGHMKLVVRGSPHW